jgi:hypothetical protein
LSFPNHIISQVSQKPTVLDFPEALYYSKWNDNYIEIDIASSYSLDSNSSFKNLKR